MISSIDLFFSRDCGGGGGPDIDPPRLVAVGCTPIAGVVAAGFALASAVVAGVLVPSVLEVAAAVEGGKPEVDTGLEVTEVAVAEGRDVAVSAG